MPRNLDKRVEVIFPVEDALLKLRIDEILSVILRDTTNARIQQPDTEYVRIDLRGKERLSSQQHFIEEAQ